jgi:hypothetical protein
MPLHSITHMFEYVYHDTRSNSSAQTAGMQKQKCLHANAQVYAIGSAANWSIYPTLCKDGGCSASNNMHLCLNALLQPRCSCSQDAVAAKMQLQPRCSCSQDAVAAKMQLQPRCQTGITVTHCCTITRCLQIHILPTLPVPSTRAAPTRRFLATAVSTQAGELCWHAFMHSS